MQISRHWRMKNIRYRLEGIRTQQGEVQLNNRISQRIVKGPKNLTKTTVQTEQPAVVVGG